MIYRDSIGLPNSGVTVSVFGGTFDKPYFAASSVSDYKTRKWSIDTPVAQIVEEMEADGFACTVRRDGRNTPVIDCVHVETQKVVDAQKKASAAKFANAQKGFVRFGDLPKGGKSKNYRDNVMENGVSCFEAEFAEDGSYRLLLTPVLQVSYLTVCTRQAFRLYGEVVGTGADGEPLLRVSECVAL